MPTQKQKELAAEGKINLGGVGILTFFAALYCVAKLFLWLTGGS